MAPFPHSGLAARSPVLTRRASLGFRALCLLSGSAWILDEYFPHPARGPRWDGLLDALLAIIFLIFWSMARRFRNSKLRRPAPRTVLELGLCGALLFALPRLAVSAAASRVTSYTETLLFMLVPLVVVFAVAHRQTTFGLDDNPLRLMLPALAALAGAALIIPFTWPASMPGQLSLALVLVAAVLAALAAVYLHRLLAGLDLLPAAAILFGASAAILLPFGGFGPFAGPGQVTLELLRSLTLQLPLALLAVWLLRAMPPIAFSTRYFLVPLIAIVESLVILRPGVTWTTAFAVLLLGGGSLVLLRAASAEIRPPR